MSTPSPGAHPAPHTRPAAGQQGPRTLRGAAGRGRWRVRDWRVRSRLVALIAIPTAVAVLLGGLRIAGNADEFITHQRVQAVAELTESVAALAHQLGVERLLTVAYLSSGADPGRRDEDRRAELTDHQAGPVQELITDVGAQAAALDDPGSELARSKLTQMLASLDTLEPVREEAAAAAGTAVLPAATAYRQIIASLLAFTEEAGAGTDNPALRDSTRAVAQLAAAREELSVEAALMLSALSTGSVSVGIDRAVNAARSRHDSSVRAFTATATVEQRAAYEAAVTADDAAGMDPDLSAMTTVRLRALIGARTGQPVEAVAGSGASGYEQAALAALDTLHGVEADLGAEVTRDAGQLQRDSLATATREAVLVLLVIVAVFMITVLVARSMVLPLRTLRDGALRVADADLPGAIHRMRETGARAAEAQVASIGVDSLDEIGEVARSFDEVHQVALRLASDEAALRSNVNAMFVNLSRRSQTLVERQLRLIEGLERGEQDSERLGDLFQLDHLATRMRRNNENLLVLSGQANTRTWAHPVPLVDVLRGAVSEVEKYERVNVRAPSHIALRGRPVNDVIHLVAELLENATAYSSDETQVSVEARELEGAEVLVEITDSGIGIGEPDIEEINERLARPPLVDVAASRRMGLFVVAHLAARHGIHVRLRPARGGGTTAAVVLPAALLLGRGAAAAPSAVLGAGAGVPDTYAEAAAAFAATPAAAEPEEGWQAGDRPPRPVWEPPEPRPGLPRRPPPGDAEPGHEPPPSGEDLWAAKVRPTPQPPGPAGPPAAPAPRGRRYTGPMPVAGGEDSAAGTGRPPQEAQAPPASNEARSQQPPAPAAPADAPGTNGTRGGNGRGGWNRPPEQANEPLRGQVSPEPDAREGYGSTAYLSRRSGGGWRTVIPPAPEDAGSESLPIFRATELESRWFRRQTVLPGSEADPVTEGEPAQEPAPPERRDAGPLPEQAPSEEPAARAVPPSAPLEPTGWDSQADAGWQRAAAVAGRPQVGGLTPAGLPQRVPRTNLVPGTAPAAQEQPGPAPHESGPGPGGSRSAERVRSRLADLQQGTRRGRETTTRRDVDGEG